MKELLKNKKLIYIVIALIIIIGIISIFVLRLNFTLMYSEHTRINVYLGKNYELQDIKQISQEVFGDQEIIYQEIETFHDSLAITVKQATEEQITNLETKLKEKYEIDSEEEILQVNEVGHLRGRDIVRPYIIPMIISTLVILAYVGIRYLNLGVFRTTFTLFLRLIISEALLLSVIAIVRIPIGIYTMPVAIILYLLVIIYSIIGFEKKLAKKNMEESKK